MFDDLTPDDWTRILIYGGIALYVSTSIPRLFRGRFVSGLLALAFWTGALALSLIGYSYRGELGDLGQRIRAVLMPGTVVETGPREVTVFRRTDGQFVVNATINGKTVAFVLDTGASTVVLRSADAARLKISLRSVDYDTEVSTANGRALTAAVVVPSLAIGGIVEHDVPALVAKPNALQENLLGMSYLNKLDSYTFKSDRLILRGR